MVDEVFSTMVRRLIFAAMVIALALGIAHGQNAGVVGIYTGTIQVFNAQALGASSGGMWQCNGSQAPVACPVLPDHGYASQELFYCNTGFSGTIDLEWSPTYSAINLSATFYPLVQSSWSLDSACHTLQLGGYYPNLRSTMTRSAGSVSAWYTASASPIPLFAAGLGSNGPTSPLLCDHNVVQDPINTATGVIATPLQTGDTIILCGLTTSFSGATSGGTLEIQWSATSGCGSLSAPSWEIATTSSTPQYFSVSIPQRSPAPSAYPYPCLVNNSGATVYVTFSYASVHGL